jgi:hypothetical protein
VKDWIVMEHLPGHFAALVFRPGKRATLGALPVFTVSA